MVLLCYPEYSEGTIRVLSPSMRKVKVSKLGDHLSCTTTKLMDSLEYLRQAGLVISVTDAGNHYLLVAIKPQGINTPVQGP